MILRVEPVSRAAAEPIAMLHQACFAEDPWDVGAIAQMMELPGFFGCVGWQEDVPVGFALALDLREEAEILALGVVRDHQRKGIGSALLAAVCREARVRGAESVVLEVAVNNAAARALYAARGFIVAGHRRNYYRQADRLVNGLILRCALAAAVSAP